MLVYRRDGIVGLDEVYLLASSPEDATVCMYFYACHVVAHTTMSAQVVSSSPNSSSGSTLMLLTLAGCKM